jgi:hypothetical protein
MAQTPLEDSDSELLSQIRHGRFESADPEDIRRLALAGLIRSERGRLTLTPLGNQMLLEWVLQHEGSKE